MNQGDEKKKVFCKMRKHRYRGPVLLDRVMTKAEYDNEVAMECEICGIQFTFADLKGMLGIPRYKRFWDEKQKDSDAL